MLIERHMRLSNLISSSCVHGPVSENSFRYHVLINWLGGWYWQHQPQLSEVAG